MKTLTATLLLALSFSASAQVSSEQVESDYTDSIIKGKEMCMAIAQNAKYNNQANYDYCVSVINQVSIGGRQKGLLDAMRLIEKNKTVK